MTSKKWLIMFASTVVLFAVMLAGFNILTDPFGVFGDPIFDWTSYNATNNPRTAKISYLDKNHEKYDSYIIGCSSTSSFPVDAFNEIFDAKFYNLIMYGADMLDCEDMAKYVIENYEVKNIVLNVYLDNGIFFGDEPNEYTHSMLPRVDGSGFFDTVSFYTRFAFANPSYGIAKIKAKSSDTYLAQSFDVFDEKTGAYDKKKRDAEPIRNLADYYSAYPVFLYYPEHSGYSLPKTKECMDSVERIVRLCEESGVELTVVTAPVYADYIEYFDINDVINFYSSLAEVTDFWDFSYSSVSFEPRYFYDSTHFRNAVGYMAAARMGENSAYSDSFAEIIFEENGLEASTTAYIPDDFGYYVTAENANEYFASYANASAASYIDISKKVPVLMYHHISETQEGAGIITPEVFEDHIKALADNGYTAISFSDLYAYVNCSGSLPAKPIVITFDDGYTSNYEYAYPILEKYGMCSTIFVIGSAFGCDTYKDTGVEMLPHFGPNETIEMVKSGLIDIQSHTFDMHQSVSLEKTQAREHMAQLDGESEDDYISAIRSDINQSIVQLEDITDETVYVLAYPQGYYNDLVQTVLSEAGIKITLSTDWGVSTLIRGLPQSLFAMKRLSAGNGTDGEALITMIEGFTLN
ncbi:MAG: polysaccharide deacetylase family protein [Ruminococcaceae bacterium]|nr:polysaccharide deacetylase family protein [Oscillospiraceae bacterium]